jgi:transmembrane sensor
VVRKERRPFEVLSGGVLVHDSSTRFDVYKKRDSTLVTITEGRVRVVAPVDAELRHKFEVAEINTAWERAPEFYGLQQVEFHEGTGTLQVRPDLSEHKLSQLLAWQRGRIELDNSTLDEALEQFARYQPATSFRYSDRSLSRIRISGSFESIRLDEFLVVLEHEFHIHSTIARTGTETIIAFSRQR